MRRRPLTLGDVLDGMVDLFTTHWRVYVLTLGPVVLPLSIVVAWLQTEVYGGAGVLQQLTDPTVTNSLLTGGPPSTAFAAAAVLSLISTVFISPLLYGVSCRIAADGYEGRDPAVGEVVRAGGRRYPALVGTTLVVLGGALVLVGVPVALIVAGGTQTSALLVAVGAVTLAVMVVPTLALAVLFSLVYPCVIVEGVGPVGALRRSYRLVRGQFWRVVGLLLLGSFIATLVSQIVALPFGIPGDIWGTWAGVVLASVGTAVSSLLSTPLVAGLLTLIYFDGRIRREGYDLELMIRALGPPERALG